MTKLIIKDQHLAIVRSILDKYDIRVFVFGSRSKGGAQKFSDLDLLIKEKIEQNIFIKLKNDFEESNLPYKVNVITWDSINDDFREQVKDDLISINERSNHL